MVSIGRVPPSLSILGSGKKLIPCREGNGVGSQSSSSAIGLQHAVVCLLFLNESLTVFAEGKRLSSSGLWGFCWRDASRAPLVLSAVAFLFAAFCVCGPTSVLRFSAVLEQPSPESC